MKHVHLLLVQGFETAQLTFGFFVIACQQPFGCSIGPEIFTFSDACVALAAPVYLAAFAIAIGSGF